MCMTKFELDPKRARLAMAAVDVTFAAIALEVGASESAVRFWLRGVHPAPAPLLRRIAQVLKVSPRFLVAHREDILEPIQQHETSSSASMPPAEMLVRCEAEAEVGEPED